MFYFLHSEQRPTNYNYYKGLLFEDLLRIFLAKLGCEVELARKKHNSLEYDIEGAYKLDKRRVRGREWSSQPVTASPCVA